LHVIAGGRATERMMPVGRWSLWREETTGDRLDKAKIKEQRARQLLQRYGIVFRDLLARESVAPSWRTLAEIYRRLEARGEIRGGRFVNGFVGEQFALPEAVERLRAERRAGDRSEAVIVSCADPLNFVGILAPGSRLSPYSGQAIVYRDGVPIDVGPLGALRSRLQRNR
jgi:ATP-dependent helicase Lhr and Lhr-like helicase